jgi:hypothetical protein
MISKAAQARVRKLAKAIGRLKDMPHPDKPYTYLFRERGNFFQMALWRENWDCGTVACIGGTAQVVLDDSPEQKGIGVTRIRKLLELDDYQGDDLFYLSVTGWRLKLHEVTVAQAVKVLNHYADTGEVDWSVANG